MTNWNRRQVFAMCRAALRGCVVLAGLVTAMALACPTTPALGAFSHNQAELKFTVNGPCDKIYDIAVLEPEGLVYVSCLVGEKSQIKRFDLDGNPAPFSGSAPYISGNALISNPGSQTGDLINESWIAVDSSGSPNHGKLFVASAPDIDVFSLSGETAFKLEQPVESTIDNDLFGLDIGPDGSIYVRSKEPKGRVSKYSPQLQEVKRLYPFGGEYTRFSGSYLRIDSSGGVWSQESAFAGPFESPALRKWEADQFTTELEPRFGTPTPDSVKAKLSPFVIPNPLLEDDGVGSNTIFGIDIDLTDNEIYVDRGNRIEIYSQGVAAEPSYLTTPAFGLGELFNSTAIAVMTDHRLFASTNGSEIVRFGPGDTLPDVHTIPPSNEEIGRDNAVLHGRIELSGGTDIQDCKLEYGADAEYLAGSVQCDPDAAGAPPTSYFDSDLEVAGTLSGLTTGQVYHYRFSAANEQGRNYGVDHIFVPAFVLKLQTAPASGITPSSAKLNAFFDPDGRETEYKFQYGVTSAYGEETAFESGGNGVGLVERGTTITGLPTGKTFHYRVIAKNAEGTTVGGDRTFRVASTPDVFGVRASDITETSAILNATINPVGVETQYKFEYGTTPSYGKSVPASLTSIGSGGDPVSVSQKVTALTPGVTYHFRVVAENEWGVNASDNTTFDFSPPACPNNHVRQQTDSTFLPDCRAYELVSPGSAGTALLMPSDAPSRQGSGLQAVYGERVPYMTNYGFATSPSRFTFWGTASSLPGTESPVSFNDMYMATRTNTGWVTKVPGLHNNEATTTGRKLCSESMEICLDHTEGGEGGFPMKAAPYVFNSNGEYQGRLPTNLGAIEASDPDASEFYGAQTVSADFSHYAFTTNDVPFAPGGVLGGIGSAYDNDIAARTVSIISKLPNGSDIPQEGPIGEMQKAIDFRGISPTGSHILMETPAAPVHGTLRYLFMRVDGVTYDISRGNPVEPLGMTRNGSKVFFTTSAQMPGTGDIDASVDLYMWEENGEILSLLSKGGGNGNTDSCDASWGITACDVKPITPERAHPALNRAVSVRGQDDQYAEESGDVYFYSPELLDAVHPGIKNQRNLYVFRNGAVEFVAVLDEGTEIQRMQISPDGANVAMLTASRLAPYDNRGLDQVYSYDVDSGVIRCASCNPSGVPPTANVTVSQSGRFMSNDGRTFFSTADSLVVRDQNGTIIDVYEYVGGRPQMISSGFASNDYTGGAKVPGLLLPNAYTGLEAVSRDGTDVYFSTFDTLVEEDRNGEFVKFYNARTGGGFPRAPDLGACAAADECHGADSAPPVPPTVASDSHLGKGGNAVANQRKARKKKKQRRAHRKSKRTHSGRNGA